MSREYVKEYFEGKDLDGLKNAITPSWTDWNLASHMKLLDVKPGVKSVLEIGCGIGRVLREIATANPECKVVGIDASRDMVREGEKFCADLPNIKIYHTSERTIESFAPLDFAFSWLVFQHIPSTEAVLRYVTEAANALRPGGVCKFQLLTNDEFPGKELWSWHSPVKLVAALDRHGCSARSFMLTQRWTMVEGRKKILT